MAEYEINLFAMKRSGTHAVINWIASMYDKDVCFFDNCTRGQNAVEHKKARGIRKGTEIEHIFANSQRDYDLNNCGMYFFAYMHDPDIQDPHNEQYIGESKKKFNIVLVRSLHNWAASLMIFRGYNPLSDWVYEFNPKARKKWLRDAKNIWASGYNQVHKRIGWWVHHAEHVENTLWRDAPNNLVILFDEWFKNQSYRQMIADRLGVKYSEKSLKYIGAVVNEGSSFDRMDYDGAAQEMNVLTRWRRFKDSQIFWDTINQYPEAVNLSKNIFGELQ